MKTMENFMVSSSIVIILLAVLLFILEKWSKIRRRDQELEEMKLIFQFRYNESKQDTSKFLNEFIEDCLQDYVMNNIIPDTGLSYIQKDKEDQIRKDITDMVSRRMSPFVRKKILMAYSEDYLAEALAEKIFYVVSLYVADFNADKPRQGQDIKPKKQKIQTIETDEEYTDW